MGMVDPATKSPEEPRRPASPSAACTGEHPGRAVPLDTKLAVAAFSLHHADAAASPPPRLLAGRTDAARPASRPLPREGSSLHADARSPALRTVTTEDAKKRGHQLRRTRNPAASTPPPQPPLASPPALHARSGRGGPGSGHRCRGSGAPPAHSNSTPADSAPPPHGGARGQPMRSPRRRLPRGCAGFRADTSDHGEERGGDGRYAAAEAGGAAESPRAEGNAEAQATPHNNRQRAR
ncbi:translation initiation factor IF-2-like [Panicum virgatum]|uniref:translation initiation factor IF-2-like n=1 Tax=Panicum virgatum TaxID=38727 RepID=UPI0019D5836A|nr:translation initiation factor IF-2-like [Panicum virgatum]